LDPTLVNELYNVLLKHWRDKFKSRCCRSFNDLFCLLRLKTLLWMS